MFGMSHDAYLLLDALVTIIRPDRADHPLQACIPSSP